MQPAPLFGLILSGGASVRMGADKAALDYHGHSQLQHCSDLLTGLVEQVFVSARADQTDALRARFRLITDSVDARGPGAGLGSAQQQYPRHAWLLIACDMPLLDHDTISTLVGGRARDLMATCYCAADGLPEPLCSIWEPASAEQVRIRVEQGGGLRRLLLDDRVLRLPIVDPSPLRGANTPAEHDAIRRLLGTAPRRPR